MNELLLIIGSWISLLTRPLVALQILTTGGIILASYYFVRPRISKNKPRLLFPIDIALWITLKASLYLFSSFGFPVGLSDFMTNAYFVWLIMTGGRLLMTSWGLLNFDSPHFPRIQGDPTRNPNLSQKRRI